MKSQEIGKRAEQLARYYLEQKGLIFKYQNFHSRYGEIDLIMQQGNDLCFIEVRARKYQNYGTALDTVSIHKQQKIIQTAQSFLQLYPENERLFGRFDVIGLQYSSPEIWLIEDLSLQLAKIDLEWIQDAYTL